MSAQDCETMVRSSYDAYSRRDFDRARSAVAEKLEFAIVATGETVRGREGWGQMLRGWATALPDSQVEIANVVAAGDHVCVEFAVWGTHTGPLHSPAGPIPPTGRTVELRFCDVIKCADGKIVGRHSYFDLATLMQQLGLVP